MYKKTKNREHFLTDIFVSIQKVEVIGIATGVLSPYLTGHILEDIRNAFYYSFLLDASKKGDSKFHWFCVQFFSDLAVKHNK